MLACASGPLGTNADYVMRLADALTDLRARDDYIDSVVSALQRFSCSGGRAAP